MIEPQIKRIIEFDLYHYSDYVSTIKKFENIETAPAYAKRAKYIVNAIEHALLHLNDAQIDFFNNVYKNHYCSTAVSFSVKYCCDLSTAHRCKTSIINAVAKELGYYSISNSH